MNFELESKEVIIDDREKTEWLINQNNGTIITNITKLLNTDFSDAHWAGDDKKFIELLYTEWESTEHFAIVTNEGRMVKKGIKFINDYIPEEELFIVTLSGFGLGEEATYYNVGFDDWKTAVIDNYGDFVMTPVYNKIEYYDDEKLFYANGKIYDLKGKFLRDDK